MGLAAAAGRPRKKVERPRGADGAADRFRRRDSHRWPASCELELQTTSPVRHTTGKALFTGNIRAVRAG